MSYKRCERLHAEDINANSNIDLNIGFNSFSKLLCIFACVSSDLCLQCLTSYTKNHFLSGTSVYHWTTLGFVLIAIPTLVRELPVLRSKSHIRHHNLRRCYKFESVLGIEHQNESRFIMALTKHCIHAL